MVDYSSPFLSTDDDSGCLDLAYIVGPRGFPGPQGPQGATGPAGPAGSSGLQAVVNATSTIPAGQVFTIVNATAPTVQTLPPISEVLVDGIATPYVVFNVNAFQTEIIGSGTDQINFSAEAYLKFKLESVVLLPTSLGWLVI